MAGRSTRLQAPPPGRLAAVKLPYEGDDHKYEFLLRPWEGLNGSQDAGSQDPFDCSWCSGSQRHSGQLLGA